MTDARGTTALMTAVGDLARAAVGDFSADDMLRCLCEVVSRTVAVDGAGVMGLDGHGVRYVHAVRVEQPEKLQGLLQEGPCADSLRVRRTVVQDDLRTAPWPHWTPRVLELDWGSVAAVPLIADGRLWGGLDLYRRAAGSWPEESLAATQMLADVTGAYLLMAADRDAARERQTRLAHEATHDPLTGLPNRALLHDRLQHALASTRRRGSAVSVLFIDLDDFKRVNDIHGHHAGDVVLIEVARRIRGCLRASDTVARPGGDEFVLICEDLGGDRDALDGYVRGLSQRLRAALQEPMSIGRGQTVVVGASIGSAVAAPDHEDAAALLRKADESMYEAKRRRGGGVVDLAAFRTTRRPSGG